MSHIVKKLKNNSIILFSESKRLTHEQVYRY